MADSRKSGVDALGYLVIGLVICGVGGLILGPGNSAIGVFVIGLGGIFTTIGSVALGVQVGMDEVDRRRSQ